MLYLFFFNNCSNISKSQKIDYEKNIKGYRLERPVKKLSLGIIHYKDNRKNWEVMGKEFGLQKVSVSQMALKITEEILRKEWEYVSITVIPMLELPKKGSLEYDYLKKQYQVDYIFIGEIEEAMVKRVKTKSSFFYKLINFLNKGFIPETFTYEATVKLNGKLYSFEKSDYVWAGSGNSKMSEGKDLNKENLLILSLHNAIGKMLQDMSKSFSISIKEIN